MFKSPVVGAAGPAVALCAAQTAADDEVDGRERGVAEPEEPKPVGAVEPLLDDMVCWPTEDGVWEAERALAAAAPAPEPDWVRAVSCLLTAAGSTFSLLPGTPPCCCCWRARAAVICLRAR